MLMQKSIYLDMNYFTTHSTGAMINTIVYDVATFADGMSFSLQTVIKTCVKVILFLFVITIINARLNRR